MKRISFILILLTLIVTGSFAQPSKVKNAYKAIFTLNTYNAKNELIGTSHGVFIKDNGEAISDLKPFLGASKATITDSKGKVTEVKRIIGINEIYDVAHFTVQAKTPAAQLASASSKEGSQIWLVSNENNKLTITSASISRTEKIQDKYSYYIFNANIPNDANACPFVNAEGEVLGLLQPSITSSNVHAVDAQFAASIRASALSYNDLAFKQIHLPVALPANQDQALLFMMMSENSNDSIKRINAINDFISSFPTAVDGYSSKAQYLAENNQFDEASSIMETAIKKAANKDEAHFKYSKLIYWKQIYKKQYDYKPWTLNKALKEVKSAGNINSQPAYKFLEGQILFAKGDYSAAYTLFNSLTTSYSKNGEIYYQMAQCRQMLNASQKEIIALLDSAISHTDTLRLQEAAPYFWARANAYNADGQYRQAVFDFTRYEIVMNHRVGADFYYTREQAEKKGKLFQQALADITRAVLLAPQEPAYIAEKANLEIKINMLDNALVTAQECVKRFPDYSDGILILGLVQIYKGNKTEGLSNMRKAQDMGNEQAKSLVEKYSK